MSFENKSFRCGTAELDSPIPTKNPVWEAGHLMLTCTGCPMGCKVNGYGLVSEAKYLELVAQVKNK